MTFIFCIYFTYYMQDEHKIIWIEIIFSFISFRTVWIRWNKQNKYSTLVHLECNMKLEIMMNILYESEFQQNNEYSVLLYYKNPKDKSLVKYIAKLGCKISLNVLHPKETHMFMLLSYSFLLMFQNIFHYIFKVLHYYYFK